jgi:7-cyano-7-deazaguanine synthase
MKRCVVLSSGGVDSTTVMAIAKNLGYDIYSISFDYGQRHKIELECAKDAANHFGVKEHKIVKVDLREIGGSALTDDIDVPKAREIDDGIPVTYVPARNVIFLSLALSYAEVNNADDIFIGANAIDYSGYPDCRPEFISAFENMANLALKSTVMGKKVHIKAPLINMTKCEIIKNGLSLGVDYSLTFSCYDPYNEETACGKCDSCRLRLKGFKEAGAVDPIKYR